LLKVSNVDIGTIASSSGIPDCTVFEEIQQSPLKAFFEAYFTLEEKDFVDSSTILALHYHQPQSIFFLL